MQGERKDLYRRFRYCTLWNGYLIPALGGYMTRTSTKPLKVLILKEEATVKINEMIAEGNDILYKIKNRNIEFYDKKAMIIGWVEKNSVLLTKLFYDDDVANDFRKDTNPGYIYSTNPGKGESQFPSLVQEGIVNLRTLDSLLEFCEDAKLNESKPQSKLTPIPLVAVFESGKTKEKVGEKSTPLKAPPSKSKGKKVFIVHGHDSGMTDTVARFVEKLGLETIILREKPNEGNTLIEKLEAHSDVDFTVVLLSPDDEGREKGSTELSPRSRQNVVFELGYFVGKIDRKNVCAILKGDVEITSDITGVVYVPMDEHEGWKRLLAREIKKAGLHINSDALA
jgi:predicted nucleotide-binding protein